jgi:hypothetical protein
LGHGVVDGPSEEADPGNTTVYVSEIPHLPEAVHTGRGQINFRLRPIVQSGPHHLRVVHRGAESQARVFAVTGDSPAIRGLEPLNR